MERKIGEVFKFGGEWYQCVEGAGCDQCAFNRDENTCTADNPHCTCRSDKKSVIFKKLEKVGEPFTGKVHIQLQRYKIYTEPKINSTENVGYIDEGNTIAIEIKQTKEDMEEKKFCEETSKANEVNMIFKIASKYINGGITYDEFGEAMRNWINGSEKDEHILKEFDLEAAKAGKSVCTRDGRKARIICFDAKGDRPIIALVEMGTAETPNNYPIDGKAVSAKETSCDLMMLPEKKEGWVNVYREETNNNERLIEQTIYKTRKEAFNKACPQGYITTTKINWEE